MRDFRVQNDPFILNKTVLVQTIIITFISQWKNILQWIQIYEMSHLWAQNGPFTQMIFFQETC